MTKELKSIRNGLVKGIRSCMQKDDNLNVLCFNVEYYLIQDNKND